MASISNTKQKNCITGAHFQNSQVKIDDITINYAEADSYLDFDDFDPPRPIPNFKGRTQDIETLDNLFFNENKTKIVICGLPGFGKTELAKIYVDICVTNKSVKRVYWLNAENEEDLKKSHSKLKKIYKSKNSERCLVIFDNGISRSSIVDYEPPDNHNFILLITSQTKDWGDDVESVELEPLSTESSIEVLKSILHKNYNEEYFELYKELAHIVSFVPLGLQIIGGYVRKQIRALGENFKLKEYITELKREEKKIIEGKIPSSLPTSYKQSIYGAIQVSLIKLKNDEDIALRDVAYKTVLHVSYFRLNTMNISIFRNVYHISDISGEDQLKTILNLLENYSFLTFKNKIIEIHRLTQAVVRYHFITNEPQLHTNFYNAYLEYIFDTHNIIRFDNFGEYSVLQQGDHNKTLIHQFFINKISNKKVLSDAKNIKNNLDRTIMTEFLENLIKLNCFECLYDILNSIGDRLEAYVLTYKLLHRAAHKNQKNILRLFLKYVNVNITDEEQNTTLHIAAQYRRLDAIDLLVNEYNADTCIFNKKGHIPIFDFIRSSFPFRTPCEINWQDVLDLFKYENTNINENGESLLHAAANSGAVGLVHLLITKYKMDANLLDAAGRSPLLYSINENSMFHRSQLDTKAQLIKLGAIFDIKWSYEIYSMLLNAVENCTRDDIDYYNKLLQLLPLDNMDELNLLLHTAARIRNGLETMKILIICGADINATDEKGNTAFFNFCRYSESDELNHDELNKILDLLQSKQNVNDDGETVLHVACKARNSQLVTLLLKKFAVDVNQEDHEGNTPLHAIFNFDTDDYNEEIFFSFASETIVKIIKSLKTHGASTNVINKNGLTPIKLLQKRQHVSSFHFNIIQTELTKE